MLYSRPPANCWRALFLLSAVQLYACGSGSQNADSAASPSSQPDTSSFNSDISVTAPEMYRLALNVSNGGLVLNHDTTLHCSEHLSVCDAKLEANSIEKLHAISRFGYSFEGWNSSSPITLDIKIVADTLVDAVFHSTLTNDPMLANGTNWSCDDVNAEKFRVLHLGDSLTRGPTPNEMMNEYWPEHASIAFYEQQAGLHVEEPLIVSLYGLFISGMGGDEVNQRLPDNHYWKQSISRQNAGVNDFNAAVVALGSNDVVQIINGLDADFVIEQRVKPLLQWLGNKPIYWILPHYGRWPTTMQNIHFGGTADGLDCSCDGAPVHAIVQCNIVDEMQACAVDQELQRQTIAAFRAIHALRERLVTLQNEYENLIVVDAAQTIAAASNGDHDLYTTMSPTRDTIHFSLQGAEWYAWLHAWLAMHADPGCTLPALPKWEMNANEVAMATQLNAAP